MISLASTRARTAALLTAAFAATTVAVTAPAARAEATDPVLTAISLKSSTSVKPGDSFQVAYTATDDSPTLRSVRIVYSDSVGRQSIWTLGTDLPLTGEAVSVVPQGLPNESLKAAHVELTDQAGYTIRYARSGSVCGVYCTSGGHTLDLSTLDVQVAGSEPDNAIPEIRSVIAGTPTVAANGNARLVLTQTEANPHPAQTWHDGAVLEHYSGHKLYLKDWEGDGILSGTVPNTIPNGTYVLRSVVTKDAVDNAATYRAGGYVLKHSTASTGPTSHALDFAATTITVTGQTSDHAAPVLSAVGYPKGLLQYGVANLISFNGFDDLSGIVRIHLQYSSPTLFPGSFTLSTTVTGANTASGVVPMVNPGVWQLERIVVVDGADRVSTYSPGGPIDLSALAVKVLGVPEAPNVDVITRSGAVGLHWYTPVFDGGSPVLGYSVTVSPGGKSYALGATTRAFTVTGLANNTKYSFTVRARNAVGLSTPRPVTATPRPLQRLFMTRDVDGGIEIVAVTRSNTAYIYRGTGTGGIARGTKVRTGLSGVRALLPATAKPTEDFFHGNVLAVTYDAADEAWRAYDGDHLEPGQTLRTGFGQYRHIVTTGDFNGDTRADVLTVDDAGSMFLSIARPTSGSFYSPKKIGTGWQYFTTVIGVGDLDGDRRNDLVARKKDGTLWLYAGNGTGGFRYKKQIGTSTSWKSFAQIAGMGDFTGDKRNDLLALAPNGYLYVYKGNGKGGFTGKALISKGFGSFV